MIVAVHIRMSCTPTAYIHTYALMIIDAIQIQCVHACIRTYVHLTELDELRGYT